MDPPLTTANQDGLDMGYKALKCAVSLCKNPEPVKLKLPARFMQRQSCGCKSTHVTEEIELIDVLRLIENSDDTEHLDKAVSTNIMGLFTGMLNLTAAGITSAVIFSFYFSLIFNPKD